MYFPISFKFCYVAEQPKQMKSWKGCHGFDPAVQRQVTNGIPPYIIGNKPHTPFPFGTLNNASVGQHKAAEPSIANTASTLNDEALDIMIDLDDRKKRENGTNFSTGDIQITSQPPISQIKAGSEVLASQLGHSANEQFTSFSTISDDTLKLEARKLLHNDCNPWSHTVADNPECLALFKKPHGIAVDSIDGSFCIDNDNNSAGQSMIDCREDPSNSNSFTEKDMTDLRLSDILFDHQFEIP